MLVELPITAFVPTANPEVARGFYESTLGFTVLSSDQYAVVLKAGHGAMVRIVPVKDHQPAKFTVLGWRTDDLSAAVAELSAKKIEMLRLPFPGQDGRGVMTFPNGDQVAWFRDPDGNILSVSQHA